jgi:hypothetical protein
MHQRRMSYFYLAPSEDDYAQARLLGKQLRLQLTAPPRELDDPYEDDPEE